MSIERIQKKSGIIGRSDSIQQVLEMILQVSPVDISVLITGESGTGKEMIAKAAITTNLFRDFMRLGKWS